MASVKLFESGMLRAGILGMMVLGSAALLAQTQSFDIYSYSPPAGYTVTKKPQSVELVKVDQKNRTFCQFGLYTAQASLGSAVKDIDAEWKAVVEKQFRVTGAVSTIPFPLPNSPDTIARSAETASGNISKIRTLLVAIGFPGRYVGVIFNASNEQAFQACHSDFAALVATVKINAAVPPVPAAPQPIQQPPAAQQPTAAPVITGTSPVGSWEKIISSRPAMRYNPFSKQYEYDYVDAMRQFKQVYRFGFEPNGQYTYELDAEDYNRNEQTRIVERGAYTVANGAIQFQPKSYQDGTWPRGKSPVLGDRAIPAGYARRFSIGEHPVHKESPGLQLQTKEGTWDTFKPLK